MNCVCVKCSSPYTVSEHDLAFYERVSPQFGSDKLAIPRPTHCPDCRQQRRISFRNERKLYHRSCDLSGKPILSVFAPDKPYKVYSTDAWWSDAWDSRDYAREFDFSRPFFSQFEQLLLDTPHISLSNTQSENCAYTHNASKNKDCYLIFGASFNEGCLYCNFIQRLTSCLDCFAVNQSELCYECVDCSANCYQLFFSQQCRSCSESRYLYDCVNCQHCVACTGLRNKQYYWLNKKLSPEEFNSRLSQVQSDAEKRKVLESAFSRLRQSLAHPWSDQLQTENCTGDHVYQSRNCLDCYDVRSSEDCRFCYGVVETKNSYDVIYFGYPGELLYECNNTGLSAYHCLFSSYGYGSQEITYCYNSHYCRNCFGCANMHHKEYCILNKQYSEEEYQKLVPSIIKHMLKTGEWGEFFPSRLSPYAYNETVACEYYPLSREEALEQGFSWRDEPEAQPSAKSIVSAAELLKDISEITDDILEKAVRCEASGQLFRLTKAELEFYRKQGLPLPRFHPEERHKRRFEARNPRYLWTRQCSNCGTQMQTTYAPQRAERIYCEKCYLAEQQ